MEGKRITVGERRISFDYKCYRLFYCKRERLNIIKSLGIVACDDLIELDSLDRMFFFFVVQH